MLKTAIEENPFGCIIIVGILYAGYLLLNLKSQDLNSKPSAASKAGNPLRKWALGTMYLFEGADMIEEAYVKAKGRPFVIQTPGKQRIMVTSQTHIRELNEAPPSQLSLHAIAKDFLQPKHTMLDFERKDQRGIESTGLVRAFRRLVTFHLLNVVPDLNAAIVDQLERELTTYKTVNGNLWPKRFYATLVLNLVLAHMLLEYDCKLQNFKGSRSVQ